MAGQLTSSTATSSIHDINHATDGTLLSGNVANMVTAVSFATRISLRCSSIFFDAVFDAAKYGTSISLGLSKDALTNALSTARSLHTNTQSKIASSTSIVHEKLEESLFVQVLEKYTNMGLYLVSHTFSLAELFAMTGLQFTSRTIQSSLKAAEESVRIIDGIFGSNDTSRAIASIIALVHRELVQDPDFGLAKAGKLAILKGLTKALTAFAVLQNVTHKRMMKQIPMTVLWEGLVTDEKDEVEEKYQQKNKLLQFKNNNKQQEKEDSAVIIQELNALRKHPEKNGNERESSLITYMQNGYRVTTKTTCTTTKTTTICPLDSTFSKRIIVKTNEEENGSYLALADNSAREPPKFILSTLSEKRRKRKVERQEENFDLSPSSIEKPNYHHKRRFSSPDDGQFCYQQKEQDSYSSRKYNYSTSDLTIKQRHASSNSSLIMMRQSRSSSISSFCSMSSKKLSMTTTNNKNAQNESTDIIKNIAHYMKYASAAYGESFMRILGIGDIPTVLPSSHHHHPNHHAFAHHTGNSVEDILLSSYTDRSPLHLHNPSIHALVHYVTVDHAAKAIVLTCRGTLGLSDILTDLSFDYTEFNLPTDKNSMFKAHSGMLDAAQLLAKEKGKVYQKIRQGLVKYPDYSLVMCGHSLGGGVASLLCVLWSQKMNGAELILKANTSKHCSKFVTSDQSGLPAGRPIHCYAYGPPGVMSLELSHYCTGLVTSVVHGNDIVSSLSLGLLKDFKNVATSLYAEADVAEEIISRAVGILQKRKKEQEQPKDNTQDEFNDDDQWFWAMIKTMRADMTAEKMYPPSTVYLIETIPHVRQQHKVALSRCEDVQARFSEIVFSRTMFMDHSPLMYERAIKKLCRGYST
ncbi:hypothetical protein BD408DRAFT_445622 [Parasitella parasitica]|nr:hypothetical protein BD408DRAFT_445622 [Parasitella parasitica]